MSSSPHSLGRSLGATVLALLACVIIRADVALAPLFRDGAVLQREKPLPIWGTAAPGESVAVKFHAQAATAVAGADGRWRVTLEPEQTSVQPAELIVSGTNVVRVRDVLVGDVWLCSGQSNMEFRLAQASDAMQVIAGASHPLLRHFKIPHTVADAPAANCVGEWQACTPETAGEFTAVGFFFARDLQQKLNVPIGLIGCNWGGTQIESWMSDAALQADPAARSIFERWQEVLRTYPDKLAAHKGVLEKWEQEQAAAKAAGKPFTRRRPATPEGPGSRWQPSGMYNAMVAPLMPAALRGVLWYQGEANGSRAAEYRTLFPGMIRQWRADFGQGDLPFYFVQLANFERKVDKTDQEWAFLREAQVSALALPATGMAVTIDVGNPGNIHPTDKKSVGERLARHARAQLFGEKIETDGPVFAGARAEGAALRVSFTHADGLQLKPKVQTPAVFELAGSDGKFHPATAVVEGGTLLVTAAAVAQPAAVRYAWRNSPSACLFNSAGLPASPFRFDDLP